MNKDGGRLAGRQGSKQASKIRDGGLTRRREGRAPLGDLMLGDGEPVVRLRAGEGCSPGDETRGRSPCGSARTVAGRRRSRGCVAKEATRYTHPSVYVQQGDGVEDENDEEE